MSLESRHPAEGRKLETPTDELQATDLAVQQPYSTDQIDELVFHALDEIWTFRDDSRIQKTLYERFQQELLAEKDKFDKVFRTSHGSTYFVTEDGISLRFKLAEGNELQPLYRKTLFLTGEEASNVMNSIKTGGTFGRVEPLSIQKSSYDVGKTVLELFMYEADEPPFSEDENALVVSDLTGFHLGHSISEIIK